MPLKKTRKPNKFKPDPLKSKQGRASRNKGKRGEREVANLYKDRGLQARRGVQYKGGLNSPDVIVDELKDYFNHEVKAVEKLSLYPAWEQSKKDSTMQQIPLVVHKKSRKPWLVTLSLHDWINIVQRLLGYDDTVNTFPDLKEFRKNAKKEYRSGGRSPGEQSRPSKPKSSDLL